MHLTAVTPILNVSDIAASLAWFERLGWRRCFTYNRAGHIAGAADANAHGPADFASVGAGEVEIFLCLDAQGARPTWLSWWLPSPTDVDAAHALALAARATVARPPTDEPWGTRECHLVHPDGHTFRLSAPLHL